MKKSIIIIWGILLLIKQDTIIGAEEQDPPYFTTRIGKTEIVIGQQDITQMEEIDIIVNPTNFNLKFGAGVSAALKKADPDWAAALTSNKKEIMKVQNFGEGKKRAMISSVVSLYKQKIKGIINAAGPVGTDLSWEHQLQQTYIDILSVADKIGVKSIIFPPISTGTNSRDSDGTVVITPTKAAKIAVSTIKKYIIKYPKIFEKIIFVSRPKDGPVHFLAHKKALLDSLTDDEKQQLVRSEKKDIQDLQVPMRFTQQQEANKWHKWKGVLAATTFAALLYLIKNITFHDKTANPAPMYTPPNNNIPTYCFKVFTGNLEKSIFT